MSYELINEDIVDRDSWLDVSVQVLKQISSVCYTCHGEWRNKGVTAVFILKLDEEYARVNFESLSALDDYSVSVYVEDGIKSFDELKLTNVSEEELNEEITLVSKKDLENMLCDAGLEPLE